LFPKIEVSTFRRHLNDEECLVHGDFGKRSLLVRGIEGGWTYLTRTKVRKKGGVVS
jgi:hypothetical protein